MAAQHEGRHVLDRDVELARNERAEARRVEDARHADHALGCPPRPLPRELDHRVQGVRDEDQDRLLRAPDDLLHDAPDDLRVLEEEIVAGHAGLARQARGDDHDVRVRSVFVIVGAADVGITLLNRHGFEQIETLPLRHALNDVDKNHVREFFTRNPVSRSCAYVAGSDDCYFLPHESFPFRIVQLGNLVMSS